MLTALLVPETACTNLYPEPQRQINRRFHLCMGCTKFFSCCLSLVVEVGCTKFLSIANSIASARNGLYKIYIQYPRSKSIIFSTPIWPVQFFKLLSMASLVAEMGCASFLSIQINSFSISIWPVQIFLTVVNSIASGRYGLCKIFKASKSIVFPSYMAYTKIFNCCQ